MVGGEPPAQPTITWDHASAWKLATVPLGLDWQPPDLYVLVRGEPVHLSIDLVSVQ